MKKNYMTPDMVVEKVKIDNILLTLSKGTAAKADYAGGGDAKAFDFEEEENEEW